MRSKYTFSNLHSFSKSTLMNSTLVELGVFGGDSYLYELMQALEVMAQLLPEFHSPPNQPANAKRFNCPFCAQQNIFPVQAKLTSGALNDIYCTTKHLWGL